MKQYCKILYHQLQKDIEHCKGKMFAPDKEVECCFRIANNYWRELAEKLRNYEFENDKTEIEFFKKWKPKFTSEIEYFNLVYHSLLFQPTELDTAISFWAREHKRLEKFKTDNKGFIECYYNTESELTPYFFLRKYYDPRNIFEAKIYDADTAFTTNGDYLVATLLALERYLQYVEMKMQNL
jgi:hypothetical protein